MTNRSAAVDAAELARHPSGLIEGGRHFYAVRVFYEDTDAAGIVYYANYLRFIERARTEMMRLLGFEHSGLRASDGVNWAVQRCNIEYRRPARLDDLLVVASRIVALRGASVEIEQVVRLAEDVVADASLRLVCMRPDGRPARLPAELRQRLGAAAAAAIPPQSFSKST